MFRLPAIDFVQLSEMIRVRHNGRYEFQQINFFPDCEFNIKHRSDYWPEEFWHTIPYHDWPKDGSDHAIVIGIEQQQQQMQYRSIELNKINYIHSIDEQTIVIDIIDYQYIIRFSGPDTMRSLFEIIYQRVPCFYWDTIITNVDMNIFCLLNINFSRQTTDHIEEAIDDDDDDEKILTILPPPYPIVDGQSSSKSATTYSTPEIPAIIVPPPEQEQDDDPFWDEEELDEIVFGDD
mgnify:CR=1 FL=1